MHTVSRLLHKPTLFPLTGILHHFAGWLIDRYTYDISLLMQQNCILVDVEEKPNEFQETSDHETGVSNIMGTLCWYALHGFS